MTATAEPRLDTALARLTPRERDVLHLMAEGYSNLGISRTLFMATKTVEAACGQIFCKLGLAPSVDVNRRVLAARILIEARAGGLPS
jgi:DNA-binding NarL/FixJ family response regulator